VSLSIEELENKIKNADNGYGYWLKMVDSLYTHSEFLENEQGLFC
jgi:hypothetical protein